MTTAAGGYEVEGTPSPVPTNPATYAMLWFGFLGGPLAWSVSELVPYMIVAHNCYPNLHPLPESISAIAWPIAVAVTAAMLLTSLLALAASWRATTRFVAARAGLALTSAEAHRTTARAYLSFGGVLFAAVFSGLIVYNLVALIFQPMCRY